MNSSRSPAFSRSNSKFSSHQRSSAQDSGGEKGADNPCTRSDLKIEVSIPNQRMDAVSLSQSSVFVPLSSSQEETAALSNSLECEKAVAAIQKEYGLYKSHIDRFCKILHKHDWDLQKALEESVKCSQKWKKSKKKSFTSGRIKEILEKIKHDLEPIYVPKLISSDGKLEDRKQFYPINEPMFYSQTNTRDLHYKRPRIKNLSDIDVALKNRKETVEIEEVKRSRVVKSGVPDKVNEVKILEVRKVLTRSSHKLYILEQSRTRKGLLL